MRRDVFQAIADPNRRAIIQLLTNKTLPLNAVAENFNVSRPAISKHIRILTECGVVKMKRQGRERYYTLYHPALQEVSEWVNQYKAFWLEKLDALERFLEHQKRSSKKRKSTKK